MNSKSLYIALFRFKRTYRSILQKHDNLCDQKRAIKRQLKKSSQPTEFEQKRHQKELQEIDEALEIYRKLLGLLGGYGMDLITEIDAQPISLHTKAQLLGNNHIAVEKLAAEINDQSLSKLVRRHGECAGEQQTFIGESKAREFTLFEAWMYAFEYRQDHDPEFNQFVTDKTIEFLQTLSDKKANRSGYIASIQMPTGKHTGKPIPLSCVSSATPIIIRSHQLNR